MLIYVCHFSVNTNTRTYRKASIQSSKSTLPYSLLLLASDNNDSGIKRVIGFARVLEVVGDSSAALVESGDDQVLCYHIINLFLVISSCSGT